MKYVRPDMDKLKAEAESAADRIKNAANADEAANAYLDWDKAAASFATMNSLCYIRHTINTEDKFYDEENEFFDSANPDFVQYAQTVAEVTGKEVRQGNVHQHRYFPEELFSRYYPRNAGG